MLLDAVGRFVTSKKREIRVSDTRVAKFAAYADDVFRQLQLGVVCSACGQPPVMNNAVTDTSWKMECPCSVRILRNPEVQ